MNRHTDRHWAKYVILALFLSRFVSHSFGQQDYSTLIFEKPVKLSAKINTDYEETMPLLSEDGYTLFFVRLEHPDNVGGEKTGHDIWYSRKDPDGTWSIPANNFSTLNNKDNNAVTGMSANGEWLYTLNAYSKKEIGEFGLAKAQKQDLYWDKPEPFPITGIDLNVGIYGFYVTPDEKHILISIEGAKTLGLEDLYVSHKNENGTWDKPIHLGEIINTEGFEISPFLAPDGKTLYYSSDGLGGMGDADIFRATRLDDSWTNWSEPINMGSEINSPEFDAYFTISKDMVGYLASNRYKKRCDLFSAKINVFKYEPLTAEARSKIKLRLLDDNSEPLDISMPDEKGYFRFNKIPFNESDAFIIETIDGDENNLVLKRVDADGNEEEVLRQENGQTFVSDEAQNFHVEIVKDEPAEPAPVVATTKLHLVDKSGNILQTTEANEKGQFLFKNLNLNDNLLFSLESVDNSTLAELPVVISNKGKETTINTTKAGGYYFYKSAEPEPIAVVTPEPVKETPVVTPPKEKPPVQEVPKINPVTPPVETLVAKVLEPEPKKEIVPEPPAAIEPVKQPKPKEKEKPVVVEKPKEEPVAKVNTPKPRSSGSTPVPVERKLANRTIYFEFNEWIIEGTDDRLETIVKELDNNKAYRISLYGHADNIGGPINNQKVSNWRVEATKQYIISRGIDENRIERMFGFGEDSPADDNSTEKGRQNNRRVEIVFN